MQFGGAERLVYEMSKIWPNAPIYTACYDEKVLPVDFPKERLIPSFIQKIPFQHQLYRQLFFLHPLAFEKFNLNEFDVAISSTTRFAKSIITQPKTIHICYCNTPPRFLWFTKEYLSNKKFPPIFGSIYKLFLNPLFSYLRMHDYVAAQCVDHFIANSQNVAERIKKFYGRDSQIIYPFVDLARFESYDVFQNLSSTETQKQPWRHFNDDRSQNVSIPEYCLIVSRLGGHKRVDLAVEAFNKLGWPLKIIGEGPEREKLQALARPNIEFLGNLSDEKVVEYYFNCKAFIYPQEEDFGITALEAQAAGKPVIAYRAGGALETVVEGKTGFFFDQQTAGSLIELLIKLEESRVIEKINPPDCQENAQRFSKERFVEELENLVKSWLRGYPPSPRLRGINSTN